MTRLRIAQHITAASIGSTAGLPIQHDGVAEQHDRLIEGTRLIHSRL